MTTTRQILYTAINECSFWDIFMQELFDALVNCMNRRLVCGISTEKTNEYFKVTYDKTTQTYTRHWYDEDGVCYTKVTFPFVIGNDQRRPLDKLAQYITESYPTHVRHVEVRGQALWIYHV